MIKKILALLLVAPALATATGPATKNFHVDTYRVDTKASKIEWMAEKVTGKHNGSINLSSGELHNNHGRFAGKFVIDMNSITVLDLTGSSKEKLEGHLKSDDFFSTAKFATSTFEVTGLAPRSGIKPGEPNFDVSGKLTIKGITQDITFPAIVRFNGPNMTAVGEAKVDRTKFDIRYRSKAFFADIGDKAIYDEFTLKFDIKASM